jgi:tape measure domain-containing protein
MADLITFGIGIDEKGAVHSLNKFSGSAHVASRSAERLEKSVDRVNRMFRGILTYFGTKQLIEYADTWTLIRARINLVTSTFEQAAVVQERLFQISQRTRNTMAATSVLYTRVAMNAQRLGRSHEDMLKMVEATNAAMLISGATGVEAAQSMRQFSQALGKGRLDGDEFRTVMEAMPEVAKAIAKELGIAHGELYKFAAAGKISANTVIDALLNAYDELTEASDSIPITIGQSMILFQNAALRMVGIMNSAKGVSTSFANAIVYLAKNMDRLVAVIASATFTYIVYRSILASVALAQGLVTTAKSIAAMLQMAAAIRSAAMASAVWAAHSKIIVGIVATVATMTLGFLAYRKVLADITKETEAWMANEADLNDIIGQREDLVDDSDLKKIQNIRWQMEDMIRLAQQQVMLANHQGRNETRLGIVFDAVNKRIQARRELTGALLDDMLTTIDRERDLLLQAEHIESIYKDMIKRIEEQHRIFEQFAENIQNTFADAFFSIMNNGINSFSTLFSTIKTMFLRMLAEMAAAKTMERWGTKFAAALSAVFAGARPAGAAATVLTTEDLEDIAAAGVQNVIPMEGLTVTVSNFASLAQLLGPVLAAFGIGSLIGGTTSNRLKGTVGGAAGGAATGAAIGTFLLPVVGTAIGAIAGGIAGAIGGFLGSSKRHREELEKHRKVLEENNRTLNGLRESVFGSTIGARMGQAQTGISAMLAGRASASQVTLVNSVAAELGITLDGTRATMLQFQDALWLTVRAMTSFTRTVGDLTKSYEAYNKLFDIEDTPQQRMNDIFGVINAMAPELMGRLGLANLDMSTEAGRQAMLEGMRAIYNMILNGTLSPELLGAFSDKNELLDVILRLKDAMSELHKEVFKVTTDFPRAMDIIYYEQKFGRYGTGKNDPPTSTASTPSVGWVVQGGITIINESGDSGEDVLNKIERAAQNRRSRGGQVAIDA